MAGVGLKVSTWNVAAINNNPFEYWMTHEDERYTKLMCDVEQMMADSFPSQDIKVVEVFTADMFQELIELMKGEKWNGIEKVEEYWEPFRERKIISGFMKDKEIGAKRLASMPDRITNTINACGSEEPLCRPTVINHYKGDLSNLQVWWSSWKDFMFKDGIAVITKDGEKVKRPCEMLVPIKKAKYPAVTELEEQISIPLQALCQAVFDAILVHMMNTLSPDGAWMVIKEDICQATFRKKHEITIDIMKKSYSDSHLICLQETAASFVSLLRQTSGVAQSHFVSVPAGLDSVRDQNSIILLRKDHFEEDSLEEITNEVLSNLGGDVPVDSGDLLVVCVNGKDEYKYFIASFHGDTNGLATMPIVNAVHKTFEKKYSDGPKARLIFGLDANTYLNAEQGKLCCTEFLTECKNIGMSTCWPSARPLKECFTTYNARTFLQPQLNKACKSEERLAKGDCNPKDHILFFSDQYSCVDTIKDNTGNRSYIEGICFPTLSFPSDHGVLTTMLFPASGNNGN